MIQSTKKFVYKWSLGWLGVYLVRRNGKSHVASPDIWVINKLLTRHLRRNRLPLLPSSTIDRYENVLSRTKYWHGTGSMQYRDGEVISALEDILQNGSLTPNQDGFDIATGNMESISVSSKRMYSRIYADMHEYGGANMHTRYGSSTFWMYFYIVSAALLAVFRLKLWHNLAKRRATEKLVRDRAESEWAGKVTRKPFISWGTFFRNGSDIPDNFGILIGISASSIIPTDVSSYIEAHETRFTVPIPVNLWTALEVPRAKIEVIKKLLKSHGYSGIEIFAIEDTEQYWATKQFIDIS